MCNYHSGAIVTGLYHNASLSSEENRSNEMKEILNYFLFLGTLEIKPVVIFSLKTMYNRPIEIACTLIKILWLLSLITM
ncbi:unnamed protein product [Moneuplotes crassus]|uniref:Uncharacterized protein n=1 Tax=Euplotes crassus TaxID=5936 RepID=A0AAD2D8I7_EUPCR|nr:unnamed protein product [Moneuplotes crassus]